MPALPLKESSATPYYGISAQPAGGLGSGSSQRRHTMFRGLPVEDVHRSRLKWLSIEGFVEAIRKACPPTGLRGRPQ